jgi:hypothetical protein
LQGIDVGLTRVLTSPSLGHAVGLTSRTSLDGASVRYIPGNSKLHSCFSSAYIRYFLLSFIQLSHLHRVLFVVYLAFLQLIEFLFHPFIFSSSCNTFSPLSSVKKAASKYLHFKPSIFHPFHQACSVLCSYCFC